MKTIDLTSPDGNVFCILGYAKSFQRQLKSSGTNNDVLDSVLKNFGGMNYEEICEKLESTGLFKFTFGDDNENICPDCGCDTSDQFCDC